MLARRLVQSLLCLSLCLAVAAWLGGFYIAPAIAATLIAMSTGAYVLLAIGAGLLWPVLVLAFVLHTTRDVRLRAARAGHHGARGPTAGEPDLTRVEDP